MRADHVSLRYALHRETGARIEAAPEYRGMGECPVCQHEMIAHCGMIRCHHWQHKPNARCDSWTESMCEWHIDWQDLVRPEQREFRIRRRGKTHVSDILAGKKVIEIQNSSISAAEVVEREVFYGDMVWVFNAGPKSPRRRVLEGDSNDIWFTKNGLTRVTKRKRVLWRPRSENGTITDRCPYSYLLAGTKEKWLDVGDGRMWRILKFGEFFNHVYIMEEISQAEFALRYMREALRPIVLNSFLNVTHVSGGTSDVWNCNCGLPTETNYFGTRTCRSLIKEPVHVFRGRVFTRQDARVMYDWYKEQMGYASVKKALSYVGGTIFPSGSNSCTVKSLYGDVCGMDMVFDDMRVT